VKPARNASQREAGGSVPKKEKSVIPNNDNKQSLTPVNTKMKVPDAIIGASALVLDCNLITRNVSDFTMINGLKVIDPFSR